MAAHTFGIVFQRYSSALEVARSFPASKLDAAKCLCKRIKGFVVEIMRRFEECKV